MKSILVTGGCGFIGYNLANELSNRGCKVTVLDKALNNAKWLNKDINLVLGDIRSCEFEGQYDYVYHLAALRSLPESFMYPEEYISTNVWGTYRLINSFPGSRIVFASSSAAAENLSIYGISKRCAEHFISLHKNAAAIRFMNVFGERQLDMSMAMPAFCYALKNNKKAIINGDGSCKRDYVYVQDLVEEIIRIGESRIRGRTETGYGQPISIKELYNLLAKVAKKKPNVRFGPPRKGDMKLTCSKYKIREPKYGFMEGIRRTYRWYQQEENF